MPGTGIAPGWFRGNWARNENEPTSLSPEKAELLVREGRKATDQVVSVAPPKPELDRLVAESEMQLR